MRMTVRTDTTGTERRFMMNDHMKLQIKTMLVSIETFRNGMKIGAMKDDGIIDRNEAKISRKAEKASERYAARLKKLIGE